MEDFNTGAQTAESADTGAQKEEITGDTLFERFTEGASIDELNSLIADENDSAEETADSADTGEQPGGVTNGAEEQNDTQPEGGASLQEEQGQNKNAPEEGAKRFTQRDVDYIIGKKTGEQARRHAALLDDLAVVLGVERDKVAEAVRKQRFEMEAEEAGALDKELYVQKKQSDIELEQLRAQHQAEIENRTFLEEIERQRQELVNASPEFDMSQAVENETFTNMLGMLYRNPATQKEALALAYRAVYFDNALARGAAREREKVIASVKSGYTRAAEGAAQTTGAAAAKVNVDKMSDEQIAEISQRILNGEKISF